MNNYIPLNKAVGPKVICDGYQALIPQKLGVDAMTFNFDGSECEHATCAGNVHQGRGRRPVLFRRGG